MKKFGLIFGVLALLVFTTAGRAETWTDNFDTPQDYTVSLDGTIWDGLKLTGVAGTINACETTTYRAPSPSRRPPPKVTPTTPSCTRRYRPTPISR